MKPGNSGAVHKLYLLRCLIFPFHALRPRVLANWLQKIKPRGKERHGFMRRSVLGGFQTFPPKMEHAEMIPRVLEGQGLSFGLSRLSLQQFLISALPKLLLLGLIRQFLQRGDPQICTVKLVSLDFMPNLGLQCLWLVLRWGNPSGHS